jgi:RimJ/RimL family protein N-acetyltransferase
MTITLRPATEADIPFVMATERMPGFERTVGRWEEAAHRAEMANPASAYFIGERDGEPAGFAMLQSLDEPAGNVHLRRIAVAVPDRGVGRAILVQVAAWVFARPQSHRFWLNVAPHNERARHLYAGLGFQQEGVLREAHVNLQGERISSVLMSLLRHEWEARSLSP